MSHAQDEIAAAEAELQAAQERLAAAKAKLADEQQAQEVRQAGEQPAQGPAQAQWSYVQQPQAAQATAQQFGSQQPFAPQPNAPQSGASQPNAQQPNAPQPGAPYSGPQQPHAPYTYQPYGQQPYVQSVVISKDHVAAGLLAIFLGPLGIHKFYLGYNTAGVIMLAITVVGSLFTFGFASVAVWVISIIEGIIYLTKTQTDFEQAYVFNKHEWF